ncbi:MAG: hypothetical protein ABIJ46_02640 [bacterium]
MNDELTTKKDHLLLPLNPRGVVATTGFRTFGLIFFISFILLIYLQFLLDWPRLLSGLIAVLGMVGIFLIRELIIKRSAAEVRPIECDREQLTLPGVLFFDRQERKILLSDIKNVRSRYFLRRLFRHHLPSRAWLLQVKITERSGRKSLLEDGQADVQRLLDFLSQHGVKTMQTSRLTSKLVILAIAVAAAVIIQLTMMLITGTL